MNPRAHELALRLRACLGSLPGAVSVSLHAQKGWAILVITASSDEAVCALGEYLGLSNGLRHEEGRWWRIAEGQHVDPEGVELRCEVSGPRHLGSLPRMATAPVTLTAEQVLEAARARGVTALCTATGEQLILLASLGLDLSSPEIRRALVDLHVRGALRLERIEKPSVVRAELDARGHRFELVDESVIRDGNLLFHAVVIS